MRPKNKLIDLLIDHFETYDNLSMSILQEINYLKFTGNINCSEREFLTTLISSTPSGNKIRYNEILPIESKIKLLKNLKDD